jgi:hypothetical protein
MVSGNANTPGRELSRGCCDARLPALVSASTDEPVRVLGDRVRGILRRICLQYGGQSVVKKCGGPNVVAGMKLEPPGGYEVAKTLDWETAWDPLGQEAAGEVSNARTRGLPNKVASAGQEEQLGL